MLIIALLQICITIYFLGWFSSTLYHKKKIEAYHSNKLETKEEILNFLEANAIEGTEAKAYVNEILAFVNAKQLPAYQEDIKNKYNSVVWKEICDAHDDDEKLDIVKNHLNRKMRMHTNLYLDIAQTFSKKKNLIKYRALFTEQEKNKEGKWLLGAKKNKR